MSSSVSISIATNTAIAAAKAVGWFLTGSPTLFAETVHSIADVANQVLLKIGEVRGRLGPDALHPFGRGQERFFWALVSAISVFFVGCGLNVYHGLHALIARAGVEPFTPLVIGLLLFSLALESFTFVVAFREIGGWKGIAANRSNTTVLAVLLEDTVALLGIALTLLVAGVSFFLGPHPEFDAVVAIAVGALLGAMALSLAAINRRLLIDTSDPDIDHLAKKFLADRGIPAQTSSIVIDEKRSVVFVRVRQDDARDRALAETYALGEALKAHAQSQGKQIEAVYWKFPVRS